ncbi:MAG TPA: hypothetical protein VLQ93_13115, partial [Myxococcaceae bacterium]|nr:hypothetical protein [Myxococcaceae bacterium]
AAVLSSARSHAYGRNERVAVLIDADGYTSNTPINYWVVVDRWGNLVQTLQANPNWRDLDPLDPGPPAPVGAEYPLLDSGHFNASVRLLENGFKAAVGSVAHPGCTVGHTSKVGLSVGSTPGSNTFPPPFCFVPNDSACTFCSGNGSTTPVRGVVFFEPDGRVVLANAEGVPSPAGSGSITFLPSGAGLESAQSVVLLNTGIVRTISVER